MARNHGESCYICREVERECARLRADVERLTRELAREKEQHELTAKAGLNMEAIQRQRADTAVDERDALRALLEQLVGALREAHKVLHYETGPLNDRASAADQIISSTLAAAAPYLPPDRPPA